MRVFSWILLISLLQILYFVRVSGQCFNNQGNSLFQLRNGLVYDPSYSRKLVTWDLNIDCCKWRGVECDTSGNIIALDLDNESISNGLENSTALFDLQFLRKLNLAFNTFNSVQIPQGLENLENLEYLNLSNAGFNGQVPIEVSRMRKLVILDLSSSFPGISPLTLENPNLKILLQNLTGLRELYLDSVNISSQRNDWSEALSSLPNLTILSLKRCSLSGPIDASLSQLQSLSVLHLDMNNLSTQVPGFFSKFHNLTTLTLGSCSLIGQFPDGIFQVPTLQILDLSNNDLLNGILSRFPPNGAFRIIVLSHTNLSGPLPGSIGNLRMLSKIDLSNCNFTGPIPSSMANLTELVYLDFSFNSFNGSVPLFHMSKKLTYIDLSRNLLTGSLSRKHFEGLSGLVNLNLGYNSLSGIIPHSLFSLPFLQKLQLYNNKFSGSIDHFPPLDSSNLDTVDLSSNHLEGVIPESFFALKRLNVLVLSLNLFNGTVKMEKIQNLQNLTRLELGHNNLSVHGSSSQFPQLLRLNLASCNLLSFPDLRNQPRLIFLDLSNNWIKGDIQSWIWHIGGGGLAHLNLSYNLLVDFQKPVNMPTSLGVLDLHSNSLQGEFPIPRESAIYVDYSSNKFRGMIPQGIGESIPFASFLSLANNSFSGPIPESICKATYLQVLDLSGNNLSGSIQSCLMEKIDNLGVLNLGGNYHISGSIPDTFPANCRLKTLDLSQNNLDGKIPASLSNCASLEVLNVGNNRIEGKFPCMMKNSSTLRVLVLRNNRFHGELKCSNVDISWPNIQIIDIASNNFSGEINPKCISSWKGMTLDNRAQLSRSHLRFEFLDLNKFYYQDTVTVTIKGLEMELVKILTVFTSIDFSSNNFSGSIPNTVGDLESLYVLNISHNSFTGSIPKSIGNLSQLGSLDLSANQLTGEIPKELTSLTFLSFLNLSYNKLFGKIPPGRQLQTFSAESYAGNRGLCGFPLNTNCSSTPEANTVVKSKQNEFSWQFIFTGLGYGMGAALIIAPLALCKECRDKCNNKFDELLKLIFPGYGFSYIRYDGKNVDNIEDAITDDDDDDDDEDDDDDDDEDETNGELSSIGRYCVFCTKLDMQMTIAMHNPKCTCYYSPPTFFSPPTSASSSSSLLFVYH